MSFLADLFKPSDRSLRREQRNELFKLLEKQGFIDPTNHFTFVTVTSKASKLNRPGYYASGDNVTRYYISRLIYLDSNIEHECWFEFHYDTERTKSIVGGPWGVKYVPHETAGSPWTVGNLSWKEVKTHFGDWLKRVVQDFVLPDFWSVPELYRFAINFQHPEADATTFNENEVRLLRQGLARTEEEICRSFNLSSTDRNYVKSRFDELSLKLDRLSRFDWKGLFISSLTSLAVELAFDSEKRKLLIRIVQAAMVSGGHFLPP